MVRIIMVSMGGRFPSECAPPRTHRGPFMIESYSRNLISVTSGNTMLTIINFDYFYLYYFNNKPIEMKSTFSANIKYIFPYMST